MTRSSADAEQRKTPGQLLGGLVKRIWASEGARKMLANTFWLTLDKVIRLGIGFLIGVWVARYLGPERFGTMSYAAAWVGLFGMLATLGMDSIVVRDIIRKPENRGAILGTTFVLRIGGSLALVAVSVGISLFVDQGRIERQLIVAIIALSQVFRPFDSIDLWFQSIIKWKNVFLARNISFVFSSVVRVALILKGAGIVGFAWVYVVDAGLAAVGLLVIARTSKDKPGKWSVDWSVGKRLLADSWPLALSSIAVVVYMRIDQVMIGRMLGDMQVGIYSAAVRISEVWYFVPMAIAQSVLPYLAEAKKANEEKYWRRVQNQCTLLVWLSVLVAILFQFTSGWLIAVLYGSGYSGAANILRVHAWTGVFVGLSMAAGNWYTIESQQSLVLLMTGSAAVANIALNLVFIPAFGPVGAAIATIISQMVSTFLIPGIVPRSRKLFVTMIRGFFPFIIPSVRSEAPARHDE